MTADDFIAHLEGTRRTRRGWLAKCPAHGDKSPSLSIREAEDGRILVHCFAGCGVEEVCSILNMKVRDLFPDSYKDPGQVYRARQEGTARLLERRKRQQLTNATADAKCEAERFIGFAQGLDIRGWTDDRLDEVLNRLADAYELRGDRDEWE